MRLAEKIVLASGNPGKLREIKELLEGTGTEVVAQSEFGVSEADETGSSFEENAIIKASHAMGATGLPAIADDSGLVVDALDGRPGVHSARYAGPDASDEDNIDKLLAELDGVERRDAAFHCVACYMDPAASAPVITTGTWRGEILHRRRGARGFGYDPVFLDTASGRSSAELTADEKNARSHRGQAFAKLVSRLCERRS